MSKEQLKAVQNAAVDRYWGVESPGTPPPIDPPDPDPTTRPLTNYTTGDSSDYYGMMYLQLPKSMSVQRVSIGNNWATNKYSDSRFQYWYVPGTEAANAGNPILVYSGSIVYSATVAGTGSGGGSKTISYWYRGLTNGNMPTWYIKGRLQLGQQFSFRAGPVTGSGTARSRKGGIGWDGNGVVVKNSETASRGIAILIPSKYSGQSFSKNDCHITLA